MSSSSVSGISSWWSTERIGLAVTGRDAILLQALAASVSPASSAAAAQDEEPGRGVLAGMLVPPPSSSSSSSEAPATAGPTSGTLERNTGTGRGDAHAAAAETALAILVDCFGHC